MPPTKLEILQGRAINAYLAASRLPAFESQVYFIDGVMQPAFESLWDHPGILSTGEQLVFSVAKEIWSWVPEVKIFELYSALSYDLIELTVSLYGAWKAGPEALVDWIVEHSPNTKEGY